MKPFLVLVVVLWAANVSEAATNSVLPFRTNFVYGANLSISDLEAVIKLANRCGVLTVTEVRTELHLVGTTIVIEGDERLEGRSVTFKTLLIYPKGINLPRPASAPAEGEFWALSAHPGQEERTIVRIGDRKVRVGLLNGIKPAGADKILDAFAKGRIRVQTEALRDALSEVDVMKPSWIGTSGRKLSIRFLSRPLTIFIFTMNGDYITLVDRIRMYE